MLYYVFVNFAALQSVFIINEHKEARQAGCAHESTDLYLHANGKDLQTGRGRSLQDAKEKEILQGNGRRLRIGSLLLPGTKSSGIRFFRHVVIQWMSEEDITKLKDDAERHEKEFDQQQTEIEELRAAISDLKKENDQLKEDLRSTARLAHNIYMYVDSGAEDTSHRVGPSA